MENQTEAARKSSPPLVLIVDDVADNREVYAEYLRYRGFHTIEASTGFEALAAANRYNPDVILLDLRLPDIDGIEVSRRLRSSSDTLKIIAVSAAVFPEDISGAFAGGCHAFLRKPCLPDDVVTQIEGLLDATSPGSWREAS